MQVVVDFYTWTRRRTQRMLEFDFIRFCVVGATGFTVNLILLTILHNVFKVHITPAQLVSAECALISNFIFHTKWTYKHHEQGSVLKRLLRFHMSSWSGVLITTLIISIGVEHFNLHYLVSLVIASAIAMVWNYLWTKYYIFRSTRVFEDTITS